jgi:hypothetical protein
MGGSQRDGLALFSEYQDLGLKLEPADNAVEAGLHAVWMRLCTGRLKIFQSCQAWLAEFRLYRRDENGRVVKENDHLMDATRYLVRSMGKILRTMPADVAFEDIDAPKHQAITEYDLFGGSLDG